MNEQQDQFFVQPQIEQVHDIRLIEQPNPIFDKPISDPPKSVTFKILQPLKPQQPYVYKKFKLQQVESEEDSEEDIRWEGDSPFLQFYSPDQCVYQRWRNEGFNRLNGGIFFAASFVHRSVFGEASAETTNIDDLLRSFYEVSQELPYPSKGDLKFDSKFQSGNLFAAFKISGNEYDLVMSNDTNSTGNNQWFYFSVEGMEANKEYTFNVVNFTKSDSLFNYGMAPCVYSFLENKRQVENEKGWRRIGKDVAYRKGAIPRETSRRMYYKLTFKLSSSFSGDRLYVAHSYPYSNQKLHRFITDKTIRYKQFVTKINVGRSISRRPIEALVIAQPINRKRDTRKAVIIMARQHPGETQGSYVCEGVVDRLLSKSKESQFLIKNYVFYVICMVNPDGVAFGHYRTNLSGKDLNRKWNANEKDLNCPQVGGIKNFLQQLSRERDIRFILDLHGHSKKLNSFFYGNPCPQNPDVVRIFPFVCSKLHQAVQFDDCTFASEEYKRKAARVYLSFLYRLIHVYTFESSFYAYFKDGKKIQFNPKEYRDLGSTLVNSLFMQLQHEVKFQQCFQFSFKKGAGKDYANSTFVKMIAELKSNKQLLETGSKGQSGSDSHPDINEINNQQIENVKVISRPLSTPVGAEQPKTAKTSRKGAREGKQYNFNKPIRNIKFLEISRVNSILPDKYQLGLQPIKKKECVAEDLGKVAASNAPFSNVKVTSDVQTDPRNQMKMIQFRASEIQQCSLANSAKFQVQERKFSSVIKSNNRNIIFKFDIFNQSTRNQQGFRSQKPPLMLKNAYSQTMITYSKQHGEKIKSSQLFPHVESPDRQCMRNHSIRIESGMRGGLRKQAQLFFNGMVKKLMTQKETRLAVEHPGNKYILEKPLSIKKKQISRK